MRVGQWDDFDLGYGYDDYIGFDSTWRMGIGYNGTNDDGSAAGHPANSYGLNPPQTAITMIVLPGDVGTNYVPVGSFDYYNNDFSVIGNPASDTEYNNYLRAKIRNGSHFTNTFTGGGAPCGGYGSGPNTNYVFTGDPSNNTEWSECSCNNNPGDRRFILTSNDFTLNAGNSQRLVLALLVADSAGGCGATSFNKMRIVADTAWGNYFKVTGIKDIPLTRTINVYPNPAHDKLFIENTGIVTGEETIMMYNTLGQLLNVPINKSGKKYEADISKLPPGLYNILFRNNYTQSTTKFIKE
jgi:hypothetical protein